MTAGRLDALTRDAARVAEEALADSTTWMQFGIVVAAFALAWLAYRRLSRLAGPASLPRRLIGALDPVLQPAITALLLLVAAALGKTLLGQQWVLRCAAVVAILWLFESCIRALRVGPIAGRILRIIGIPLLTLHLLGVLELLEAAGQVFQCHRSGDVLHALAVGAAHREALPISRPTTEQADNARRQG